MAQVGSDGAFNQARQFPNTCHCQPIMHRANICPHISLQHRPTVTPYMIPHRVLPRHTYRITAWLTIGEEYRSRTSLLTMSPPGWPQSARSTMAATRAHPQSSANIVWEQLMRGTDRCQVAGGVLSHRLLPHPMEGSNQTRPWQTPTGYTRHLLSRMGSFESDKASQVSRRLSQGLVLSKAPTDQRSMEEMLRLGDNQGSQATVGARQTMERHRRRPAWPVYGPCAPRPTANRARGPSHSPRTCCNMSVRNTSA